MHTTIDRLGAQPQHGHDPAFLADVRRRLEAMLEDIRSKGEETLRDANGDFGPMADIVDRASSEVSNSVTFRLRDREYRLVRKIREALHRLDEGEFGICEECGELIAPARIMARPVTTLCLACKQEREQDEVRREHIPRLEAP